MVVVLLASVGTDSAIAVCEGLRAHFGDDVRLVGVDLKPAVACLPMLDDFAQVPPRSADNYIPELVRFARDQGATHIWPLSTEGQTISAAEKDNHFAEFTTICSPLSAVQIANDKIRLYEFSQSRMLPTPAYQVVDSIESLRRAAEELGYPKKPVVLKVANGTGAQGLKIVKPGLSDTEMFLSRLNRDLTLERAVRQLECVRRFPRMMLTEYLPGDEFSVDVLTYQGRWYGGVVRRRDDSIFGLATDAVVVDRPDVLDLARKYAEGLALEFVSNIQFRGSEDGKPRLMEVNPRVPGTIGLSIASGGNLPALALALSIGREVSLPEPKVGTRILRYFGGTVLRP